MAWRYPQAQYVAQPATVILMKAYIIFQNSALSEWNTSPISHELIKAQVVLFHSRVAGYDWLMA